MSGYMGRYPHLAPADARANRWCDHLHYWPAGDDGPEEYACRQDRPEVDDNCEDCEERWGDE